MLGGGALGWLAVVEAVRAASKSGSQASIAMSSSSEKLNSSSWGAGGGGGGMRRLGWGWFVLGFRLFCSCSSGSEGSDVGEPGSGRLVVE